MGQSSSGIKTKKLGRALGNSTDSDENSWVTGIGSQLLTDDSINDLEEDLDVRAVPLDLISINPTNARELDIEPDDLRTNLGEIKLPAEAYSDDADWIDDYGERIRKLFGDTRKSEDCIETARFAASLKSPKNILNPITTWRDETTFHLIAGERRFLAHFFLNASHAITRIWHNKPSPFDIKLLEWQENHERDELELEEKIRNMRQILEEWGKANPDEKMTVRKFAGIVSISRTQAALWYKVARCNDDRFNKALNNGLMSSIETANELAGLSATKLSTYLDRMEYGERITKDVIAKEGKKAGSKGRAKASKGTFQINNKANMQPVIFIVKTVLEKIDSPELNSRIEVDSLQKPKEITAALTAIVDHLENS